MGRYIDTEDLRKAGQKHPAFVEKMFMLSDLNNVELIVMKSRYIDGLLFKQIDIGVSQRQVFRCHKEGIRKTEDKFGLAEILDLMCQ
jgi:DNA-directed RNA polymerase specialized sigma subunit